MSNKNADNTVEETQIRLTEELAEACREYSSAIWEEALNAVGVPMDSALRQLGNIYCHPHIREVPNATSSEVPDVPKAKDAEVLIVNIDPKATDTSKSKETEAKSKDDVPKAKDAPTSQPDQKENPPAPKSKA